MKKIILITVLFFSLLSFGQVYKIEYFDESDEKFIYDVNFRKVTYEHQDSVFKISDYKLGKLYRVDIVKDTANWTIDLKTINYYKNGNIESICYLKDNLPFGENQTFYENGNKKSLFTFKFNENKLPTINMKEFWNESGLQTVINGNGYYDIDLSNNGSLIIKGKVENGFQIGVWESNNKSFPYIVEEYDSIGNLILGKRYLSKKKIVEYKEMTKQANPDGGINPFRKMIGKKIKLNLSYPVNDKIISRFIINADGKLDNIKIIKGINKEIDNEVLRALESCPKWTPGSMRGVNVKQYYTLPLKIVITPSN